LGRTTSMEVHQMFIGQLGSTKAAEEDWKKDFFCEAELYTQSKATETMAVVKMCKAMFLEDQNLLMHMPMPYTHLTTLEVKEYLQLRKVEELKKVRYKLAEKEEQEQQAQLATEGQDMLAIQHEAMRVESEAMEDVDAESARAAVEVAINDEEPVIADQEAPTLEDYFGRI
jgi:hypothetical protein